MSVIQLASKTTKFAGAARFRDRRGEVSAEALLAYSRNAAVSELFRVNPNGTHFLVAGLPPVATVAATIAALSHQMIPILGTLPMAASDQLGIKSTPACFESFQFTASVEALSLESFNFDFNGQTVGFQTSGSTGAPTIFLKQLRSLLNEVDQIQSLFALTAKSKILSLVPPSHIYGFLYGVLLPLKFGVSVHFAEVQDGLPTVTDADLIDSELIVTVPALWPLLRRDEVFRNLKQVVTSGAPFGSQREAEFLASKAKCGSAPRMIEVLGSTESGGIGYRQVGSTPQNEFHFFDGIKIGGASNGDNNGDTHTNGDTHLFNNGDTHLFSPFLDPHLSPLLLTDRLECTDQGTFKHLGRTDQIFKWGGRRYSLTGIEQELASIVPLQMVRVLFVENTSKAHGGEILAFIEGEQSPTSAIIQNFRLKFPHSPTPTDILFLSEFPRNPMGKVTAELLLAARQK